MSPALSAACNMEWREGALRRYKFREDVTEEALLCFLTWACYGDYPSSNGDDIGLSSVSAQADSNGLEMPSVPRPPKWSKKGKKERAPARGSVEFWEGKTGRAYDGSSKDTSLSVKFVTAEDRVVHPLLLHARIYVFAHIYLIEPLKASTKQKIVDQLQKPNNISETDHRAPVFDILAYTFSRLPEEDPLLHWLARYASWNLEELRQMTNRFDDLLSDADSNFAKMVVRYVSKSSTDPFNLKDDELMQRYPMPIANAR